MTARSTLDQRMVDKLCACVPESLAAFGRRIALCPRSCDACPVAGLRDKALFDATIDAFAAPYGPRADRRAAVSLWTQFYFTALIVPAVTAEVCLGCELPLALEETLIEYDPQRCPARFLVGPPAARRAADATGARFAGLIEGHLRPFIALACGHTGLSPRVLWTNAAVVFDLTVRELAHSSTVDPAALADARALVSPERACATEMPLRHALGPPNPGACRRRNVCCRRFRLPGVTDCGALCPIARETASVC